jgi:hypothetical protein
VVPGWPAGGGMAEGWSVGGGDDDRGRGWSVRWLAGGGAVDAWQVRLSERQGRERELLAAWWEAVRERDDAVEARDRLVAGRDRAVSRILGGMTVKQQTWVQRHLTYATRPRDTAGRQLVLTWLQHQDPVRECQADWDSRIDPAERRLHTAEDHLGDLAGAVLAMWGQKRCEEMTGVPWQRVAAWARHRRSA